MSENNIPENNIINKINKNKIYKYKIYKHKIDILFILIIAIFTSSLVYLLINANDQLGIYCSDVFIYLTNSLNLAGYPLGKTSNLYLSPVICVITSLIFKLGYIDQITIFTVTGIFFPIASIGTYLLFKLKLNRITSFFGAILFSSFSLNILWTANGTMDIPAIAISIWVIYFTILAVNKNPKYFLLAFPLFVIGFFTRYTVGFILPLMFLYILFEIDIIGKISVLRYKNFKNFKKSILVSLKKLIKSNSFKYFLVGILIALAIFSLFLVFLTNKGTDLTFITQTQNVVSGDKGSFIDPGFKPEPYFYIENLGNFISSNSVEFHDLIPVLKNPGILSYFVLVLISGGALIYTLELVFRSIRNHRNKNNDNNINDYENKNNYENKIKKYSNKAIYLKVLLAIIITITIIFTYKQVSSIISEILFLINILLIFNILNYILSSNNLNNTNNLNNLNNSNSEDYNNSNNSIKPIKDLNFNLLMISWFFIYLIFFSFSDVKVDRYFITVMPVIAYFGAYCLDFLSSKFIKFLKSYKNKKQLGKAFSIKNNKDNNSENNNPIENNINNNKNSNNSTKKSNNTKNNNSTKNSNSINNNYDNSDKDLVQSLIAIILILVFIVSAFSSVGIIPSKNKDIDGPIIISDWLKNYDPNYDSKVIWTYNTRYYTWYLMMNVGAAYEKDIPKLEKNNVTYYISRNISKENYTIENYTIIQKYNNINLYKRNT
nr:glycosyltransferase family 39 protein [Methanobrevibacter arboriphilus]